MLNKRTYSLSKMNEDNDYGQFTIIDIEHYNANPRYEITPLRITNTHKMGALNVQKYNKNYHIKTDNDIENNADTDNDDDPKKPDKNYYLENTIYSTTIILAIMIFIYLC